MKYLTLIVATLFVSGAAADGLDILANAESLGDDVMMQSRGGNYELNIDNIHASSDMGGLVNNNSADNAWTGDNTIDTGSFSDTSGVISVVQNTGNNVLIQNATVVNLTLK